MSTATLAAPAPLDANTLLDKFEAWFEENHLDDNASMEGRMFETYGAELAYVREICAKDPKRIVTLVEGEDDDGTTVYVRGYHFVNRMGYLVIKEGADIPDFVEVVDRM